MTLLWVALGAAVGAPARYLVDRALGRLHPGRFPWGTFAVNVVGSFVLGLVSAAADPAVTALVGVGFFSFGLWAHHMFTSGLGVL